MTVALCASFGTTLRCFSGDDMISDASNVLVGEEEGSEGLTGEGEVDGVEIQFHSKKRSDTAITPCSKKRRMVGILG